MATVFTQVGTFVGSKTKETRAQAISQAEAAKNQAISELRDGVATAGNTLKKLYALVAGNRTTHTVADLAARDLLSDLLVGDHAFVVNDGDGRWALYMVTAVSPSEFVKVADPDTMGDQMTAAQIKTLYESNVDTNEFSDEEKTFVIALSTGLASLGTATKASYVAAINEVLGKANQAVSDISYIESDVGGLTTRMGNAETTITGLGTFTDFETAFNTAMA